MHNMPIVWPKKHQAENYMFLQLVRKYICIVKKVVGGIWSLFAGNVNSVQSNLQYGNRDQCILLGLRKTLLDNSVFLVDKLPS